MCGDQIQFAHHLKSYSILCQLRVHWVYPMQATLNIDNSTNFCRRTTIDTSNKSSRSVLYVAYHFRVLIDIQTPQFYLSNFEKSRILNILVAFLSFFFIVIFQKIQNIYDFYFVPSQFHLLSSLLGKQDMFEFEIIYMICSPILAFYT